MDTWLKQSKDAPLYPDLEWEKPERKDQAGRLLIIGGNLHGFSSVAKADQVTKEAGIGSSRIMLPDALRRTLAPLWTDAIFCPSTATGSFSKDSVELVLQNAIWAEGLLVSGDLGRNSETAILLDTVLSSLNFPIAITKDALDYYLERPKLVFGRENTLVVGSFSQMQKLLSNIGHSEPLVYTMPLASLVGTLSRFSTHYPAIIVTKSENQLLVARNGTVITTRLDGDPEIWRLETTARAIVAWLHHPAKALEAIANSVI